MLKREFKVNFKMFLIWFLILIGSFLMVYLIYPYIITDEAIKSLDDMMNSMPPEMLKAFNYDLYSLTTAYGWLISEGFMMILIASGVYASILGSSALLKEEGNKTIEYLLSLPVKRSNIITNKIIVSIIYIVFMVFLVGLFNYIALLLSCDFDTKQFILLSITPLLISLPFFAVNLFISTFIHNSRMNIGLSLGVVFIAYFLNLISQISEKVEFFKYISIFSLADTRYVISDVAINPICIIISICITATFIFLSYINYQKKELLF